MTKSQKRAAARRAEKKAIRDAIAKQFNIDTTPSKPEKLGRALFLRPNDVSRFERATEFRPGIAAAVMAMVIK